MKKMRPIPAALSDVAVLVKANLSGWYMLLALLLFSLFMSGCSTGAQKELPGYMPVVAHLQPVTEAGS